MLIFCVFSGDRIPHFPALKNIQPSYWIKQATEIEKPQLVTEIQVDLETDDFSHKQ